MLYLSIGGPERAVDFEESPEGHALTGAVTPMHQQRIPRETKPSAQKSLGRAVRELRARFGLSQEALGFRSGLHRNYVGAIERGEINPTFATLLRLVRGIGITLPELIELYETRLADIRPEPLVGAAHGRSRRR